MSSRSRMGWYNPWFLDYMVAHLTMRTHGVNQAFRFVEGIFYIERVIKSGIFTRKDPFSFMRAQREMSNHLI